MSLLYIVNVTDYPIKMDLGGTIPSKSRSIKAHGKNKYKGLVDKYKTKERQGELFVFDKKTTDKEIKEFFDARDEESILGSEESEAVILAKMYHDFTVELQEERKRFMEYFEKEKVMFFERWEKEKEEFFSQHKPKGR